jgi:hypothetical protein
VYAHPVDAETQTLKLFALEAMHDLRLSPTEQDACRTPPIVPRRPDYPRNPAVDYFRRGVRAEEVFFTFDRRGAEQLIAAFLADEEKARSGAFEYGEGASR